MTPNEQNAKELLDKYRQGRCTPEEKALVESWFNQQLAEKQAPENEIDYESFEKSIYSRLPQAPKPLYRKLYPYAAAASIALVIGAGLLLFNHKKPVTQQVAKNDVEPASMQVILTSKGKRYALNSLPQGQIMNRSGISVNKSAGAQLDYSVQNAETGKPVYDTISLPTGGPYKLKLSDGTLITLNTGTTLRYPEDLKTGRQVELLKGEAFFEVTHNEQLPFSVKTPFGTVKDIGTEFDVNAYADEPDNRTTLVEGVVRVNGNTLKPGQQAIVQNGQLRVKDADVDAATAWLDNNFVFRHADVASIMRQLSRWYQVEVSYQGDVQHLHFGGLMSRNHKISSVLAIMENTGKIHFDIQGRRIMVIAGKR